MADSTSGYEELRAALGGLEPRGFEDVDQEHLQFLAQRIRRTLDRRRAMLDRETEESLRHVPRLVRPAVKKVVGL